MRHFFGIGLLAIIAACQHSAALEPAVLSDGSDANISALKAHLAEEMGTVKIEFGVSDPTESSQFTVLPPPLGEHETRSLATPTAFQIFIQNGTCFLHRKDNEKMIELTGVSCRVAQ